MACVKVETEENRDDDDLDPRIQIELERLNNATDEINKLEMELDEAQGTFRLLMNDSKRRITLYHHKLGSCIDKARPYYEALEICKRAQAECQQAAGKFQRASEIHAAAKETVALAEARYLSKQDEWQFDTAWQEMLNHATKKVMEAEHNKAESGREHQKRATLYQAAEQKVKSLEQKLKRNIAKSRPYFDEKALCESSLNAQKQRISELQAAIAKAKAAYSASLRQLEAISEDIHRRRKEKNLPRGPREPGVGAELVPPLPHEVPLNRAIKPESPAHCASPSLRELDCVLDVDDTLSLGSVSRATSSIVSDCEDTEEDLDQLRAHVKELSQMSSEHQTDAWENELSETISRLDNVLLLRECEEELRSSASGSAEAAESSAAPASPPAPSASAEQQPL